MLEKVDLQTLMNFQKFGKKIIGIGRNYAEHAKEMNSTVPTTPMIFLKPTTSYITHPSPIQIPRNALVHHEIELGVIIGEPGRDISSKNAMKHVSGYCLALDMTDRTAQAAAKKSGYPWTTAKGHDTFTPIGRFIPKELIQNPSELLISLKVNGIQKQSGRTSDMIFSIPELIRYVSTIMTLETGDLILTGTPSGVGSVVKGDSLVGRIELNGEVLDEIKFNVIDRVYIEE